MASFQRILVGFDGSEPAIHAARRAGRIAAAAGGELTVLTAADHLIRPDGTRTFDADGAEAHDTARHGAAIAAAAGARDPATRVSLLAPVDALTQEAMTGEYDLLVIGHRGVTGLRSLLMGSVAKHVIDKVQCSVLVIR